MKLRWRLASSPTTLPNLPPNLPELPNEIIHQIFAEFSAIPFTQRPALFPWYLGHICSTWRYIFLSMTAEFWSSIWIVFGWENALRTINIVRFFLERDPTAPFSFNISSYIHVKENRRVADRLRQIMEMLAHESMRWIKVSFDIRAQDMLPLIHTKDRLPLLQELMLSQSSYEGIPEALYDVFKTAPSLNAVNIRNLANWKFNWLNFKAVDIYTLGFRTFEFVATLPQMTRLERLDLDCSYNDAIPSNAIVLPSLTTLSCNPSWLRLVQAPAIEDLFIDYDHYTSDSPDIVLSFICRSCCASKILRLGITSAQASTVIEIIRHTPHITHLDLLDIVKPGNVLRQLIMPTNAAQEPLACHLLSLFFSDLCEACVEDINLLSDLISSRTVNSTTDNGGCKRLQKFEIAGDMYGVSLAAKASIIALCEERGVQYIQRLD